MPDSHSPKDLYLAAAAITDAAERDQFLEAACAGDAALFSRVTALLAADEPPAEFLAVPELDAAAAMEATLPGLGTSIGYFGDYVLLSEIARGASGVVFRARQVSLNRVVALKMLRDRALLASPADEQRFRAEAEAAAGLDHPNIVPIYEVGQHEGQGYYSMKLIEGGTLTSRSGDFREPRAAAAFIAQVARAVQHAHGHGILHRDLKPGNILLDAAGEPQVVDFGIARRLDAESSLTHTGQIIGTPHYMAPEQAGGESRRLSPATDVYSLGAVLYELLAGRRIFDGADMLTLLNQVKDSAPAPLRMLVPGLDRDLETVVMRCVEKSPAARYRSATALADDLDRWLRGEPVQARPVGRMARIMKWARRRPAHAAAAGLAALLVLTLGTAALLLSQPPVKRPAIRSGLNAVAGPEATSGARRYQLMQAAVSQEEAAHLAAGMGGRLATLSRDADYFTIAASPLAESIPAGRWCWLTQGLLLPPEAGRQRTQRAAVAVGSSWQTECHGFLVEWDTAPPPPPPPLPGSGPDGWLDLLPVLAQESTASQKSADGLRWAAAEKGAGLEFACVLPEEFDYEAEFTLDPPSAAGTWTALFFPIAGKGLTSHVHLNDIGFRLGWQLDGVADLMSEVSSIEWPAEYGRRRQVRMEVRRASIRVVFDGQPVLQWFGSSLRLNQSPWPLGRNPRHPGIHGMGVGGILHAARARSAAGSPDGGSFVGRRPPGGVPGSLLHSLTSPEWKWEGPAHTGPGTNSADYDGQPSLTADGLELFFARAAAEHPKLWTARRSDPGEPFGKAQLVPGLVNFSRRGDPSVSPDGLTLYFCDDPRDPVETNYDIAVTRRPDRDSPWEKPVILGSALNTAASDSAPALSEDGLVLVFRHEHHGLSVSRRTTVEEPFPAATKLTGPVGQLTVPDYSPFLCADGRTLIFMRNYETIRGGLNRILLLTELDGSTTRGLWRLDLPTAVTDAPWLSSDGRTLWVSANYPGSVGLMDLWAFRA